jgi:ribosome-binding protein aMBF1 (putative translation factor)
VRRSPATNLCAICTKDADGRVEVINGAPVFVCLRCATEHPRDGGYGFDDSGRANRGTTSHAKKGPRR